MVSSETLALFMLGAGFLPALSSIGAWIRNLSIASFGLIGLIYLNCVEDTWRDLACALALPAAAILFAASTVFALVRRRHRMHVATTVFGRPWIAAPLIYVSAAVLVYISFNMMTGGF